MNKLRGKPLSIIMVVVSVYGRVNGHDVIFEPKGNDYWQCKPGMPEDGIYVTEIWAKDEAGNIGYKIAKLYVYDGRCVKIEWISDDIEIKFICNKIYVDLIPDGFFVKIKECEV